MNASSTRSPVRRLYDSLCRLMSPDDLHMNLNSLEEYGKLEGDPEPRFCEWAYDALSRRALVIDLQRSVLRRADIVKLACRHGIEASASISHDIMLRETLASIGIKEPELPPEPPDGVKVLRRFRKWAESEIAGMPAEQLEPDDFSRNPVPACRRATERLLKLIAVFLHDGGLADPLVDIWTMGQYGFAPRDPVRDLPSELLELELGPLNYLLRATSRAVHERSISIPFLGRDSKLWGDPVFEAVKALGATLNSEVHDSGKRNVNKFDALLSRQSNAVQNVLLKIDTKQILVPRLVQFFRRYTDGHAVHFEGFSHDGHIVRCFETLEYDLHQPYLMCAATNPASVDMVCVPLRDWFRRPV